MVDVDIDDLVGPTEQINLTVLRQALAKIDEAAKSFHDSRSGLMTWATIEYVAARASVSGIKTAGKLTGKKRAS